MIMADLHLGCWVLGNWVGLYRGGGGSDLGL